MAGRVCPWWLGYWLVNPLRKFIHNPEIIVRPYIREGMRVLDIGSGMGYFSLPMARMAGKTGRVICVDLQEKMLLGLSRRAWKAGLVERIEPRKADKSSLRLDGLAGTIDFALAFAVVHEIPDPGHFFNEINTALKHKGMLLIAEPAGRVTSKAFEDTLAIARKQGFTIISQPKIRSSHAAVLTKT